MSTVDNTPELGLPEGETDPNLLYVAVGRAIHAWEGMEEALAYLYLKLSGISDNDPSNFAKYGAAHRKFTERMQAVEDAGIAYFTRNCDQDKEGEFAKILSSIRLMAIERHRIAHGHVTIIGAFTIPENYQGGEIVGSPALYRWGAPFYSVDNLRTNPFGFGSKHIEEKQREFEGLHNQVFRFWKSLSPAA